MRTWLPAGSRKAQSRTPYGCSVGSWMTSAPLACTEAAQAHILLSEGHPNGKLALLPAQ
jgi:hypothetical protein